MVRPCEMPHKTDTLSSLRCITYLVYYQVPALHEFTHAQLRCPRKLTAVSFRAVSIAGESIGHLFPEEKICWSQDLKCFLSTQWYTAGSAVDTSPTSCPKAESCLPIAAHPLLNLLCILSRGVTERVSIRPIH